MFGWDVLKSGVPEFGMVFVLATSRCTYFSYQPIAILNKLKNDQYFLLIVDL